MKARKLIALTLLMSTLSTVSIPVLAVSDTESTSTTVVEGDTVDFPLSYTKQGVTSEGKDIYYSKTELSYYGFSRNKNITLSRSDKTIKSVTHSNQIVKHKIVNDGVKLYVKTADIAKGEKQSGIYGRDLVKIKYTDGTIDKVDVVVLHEVDKRSAINFISPLALDNTNYVRLYRSGKTIKNVKVIGASNYNKFDISYNYWSEQSEADKKAKKYGYVKLKPHKNVTSNSWEYNEGVADVLVEYNNSFVEIYRVCIVKESSYRLNTSNNGALTLNTRSNKSVKSLKYNSKKLTLLYNKGNTVKFRSTEENTNGSSDVVINYTDGNRDVAHVKLFRSVSTSYQLERSNPATLKTTLNKSNIKSVSIDKPYLMDLAISSDKKSVVGKPKTSGLCAVAVNYENGDKEVLRITLYQNVLSTKTMKVGASYLYKNESSRSIKNIVSSDAKIATISKADTGYYVIAKSRGSCTLNITYSNMDIETVRLAVEPNISADKVVWVGDSRTVGMNLIYNNSLDVVAKSAMGYNWMIQNKSGFINRRGYNIVVNMGVNDLYQIDKYIAFYNSLSDEFLTENNVYFMSVNPVDEIKQLSYGYNSSNSAISNFNSKIKSKLNSKIKYIDTYNYMMKMDL